MEAKGIKEKRPKHLRYSFICMEINGICRYNETAPMNRTPLVSRMRHFKIKDTFSLQNAQNENKEVQSALHIQWSPCNKQAFVPVALPQAFFAACSLFKGKSFVYFYRGATEWHNMSVAYDISVSKWCLKLHVKEAEMAKKLAKPDVLHTYSVGPLPLSGVSALHMF